MPFPKPAGFAVSLVSATVLAYQVLLVRLLTILLEHHFASLIISLALLGLGAAGTVVTLAGSRPFLSFDRAFPVACALFGVSLVPAFLGARHVPFNPLDLFWAPVQWAYFSTLCLVLWVPFFFGALGLALAFARFQKEPHRLYRFDLLGGAAGAVLMAAALWRWTPGACLEALTTVPCCAAALALSSGRRYGIAALLLLTGTVLPFLWPSDQLAPAVSQYKPLSYALDRPGARLVDERSSPLGWLAVVESPSIPFRHAPGLSLACPAEPPAQLGLFLDGDGPSPVTRYDGNRESLAYLDCLPTALPYGLLKRPQVLVPGAGGGTDVLAALYHGAAGVDALEFNPQTARLVREDYADFAGHLFRRENARLRVAEFRGFLRGRTRRYDLVQLSLLDSFQSSSGGGQAAGASTLYTVESMEECLEALKPGGWLAVTRWIKVPPRDSLKLFATALDALKNRSAPHPRRHLVLIRTARTTTLLVKSTPCTPAELRTARDFCRKRSFDLAYAPDMKPEEANRFNILARPWFYEGCRALAGDDREEFVRRYKFDIRPATDDRPYFFHFFKWGTFKEALALGKSGGWSLLDWGYPLLAAVVLQAALLGAVLILLPLLFLGPPAGGSRRGPLFLYFFCLGLAFLFVEATFIHKFHLFLNDPVTSLAAVLCAFLLFAGLGSGCSAPLARRLKSSRFSPETAAAALAVAAIVVVLLAQRLLLPYLFRLFASGGTLLKSSVAVLAAAPLAFFMGMPFPLGLSRTAERAPAWVPWAWGVNGFASVLSPLLATLLSVHRGFDTVLILAAGLYLTAVAALRRLAPERKERPGKIPSSKSESRRKSQ